MTEKPPLTGVALAKTGPVTVMKAAKICDLPSAGLTV